MMKATKRHQQGSRLRKAFLAGLVISMFFSQQARASYISDGSSGMFHPLSDTVLDLSDTRAFPQFSNIFIDAGVTLRVLTPQADFGYLLASENIFVNGVLDAGMGSLGIQSGNSIELGSGGRIIAGSLYLSAQSMNLGGALAISGASDISRETLTVSTSPNLRVLDYGDRLTLINAVPLPPAGLLLASGILGLLLKIRKKSGS